MTVPKIARPIMKAKTPRVPRSSRSKPVSWPEWPWFISSLMRRLQKSQRLRRVHRQQRTRSQVVEEVGHPKTADPGNDREMHPADVKRGMRRRLNMPKNIDDAHDYEPRSEPDQTARFALQLPREQERERHGEMEHHEKQADVLPPAIHAAHVPRNFFRQVARPDDEPLRKIEVRPDHDEGEHELAVVVNFGVREVLGHRLAFAEDALDDHAETEGGERFPRDEKQPVDGRDPARLQRHHPVDHSERNRERVDDESNGTHGAETQRALARNRVLLGGPAIQEVSHPDPDDEVNDIAHEDG